MSKFDSVRDEILYLMTLELWANESDGNVEAITGWFARVSNSLEDIVSLVDAFGTEAFALDPNFDFSELVGHFLIQENSQGFVYVTQYATEAELVTAYRDLETLFSQWDTETF